MDIEKIKFITGKDGEANINKITVEMTVEEAVWITLVSGKQRGRNSTHNSIFHCLFDNVFVPYFENGVEDARKIFPVEIPPIKY